MKNRVLFKEFILLSILLLFSTGCPVRESYFKKDCIYQQRENNDEICSAYKISKPDQRKNNKLQKSQLKQQSNIKRELGIDESDYRSSTETGEYYDNSENDYKDYKQKIYGEYLNE